MSTALFEDRPICSRARGAKAYCITFVCFPLSNIMNTSSLSAENIIILQAMTIITPNIDAHVNALGTLAMDKVCDIEFEILVFSKLKLTVDLGYDEEGVCTDLGSKLFALEDVQRCQALVVLCQTAEQSIYALRRTPRHYKHPDKVALKRLWYDLVCLVFCALYTKYANSSVRFKSCACCFLISLSLSRYRSVHSRYSYLSLPTCS